MAPSHIDKPHQYVPQKTLLRSTEEINRFDFGESIEATAAFLVCFPLGRINNAHSETSNSRSSEPKIKSPPKHFSSQRAHRFFTNTPALLYFRRKIRENPRGTARVDFAYLRVVAFLPNQLNQEKKLHSSVYALNKLSEYFFLTSSRTKRRNRTVLAATET